MGWCKRAQVMVWPKIPSCLKLALLLFGLQGGYHVRNLGLQLFFDLKA